MKLKIAEQSTKAEDLIPPVKPDGSGIGGNYTDAYIKAMNVTLDDGRKITCKRRGLKITLKIGETSGEAIMNRLQDGPDVKNILSKALESAANQAGVKFLVEDGVMYLQAE